jgi:hypothetical protein
MKSILYRFKIRHFEAMKQHSSRSKQYFIRCSDCIASTADSFGAVKRHMKSKCKNDVTCTSH